MNGIWIEIQSREGMWIADKIWKYGDCTIVFEGCGEENYSSFSTSDKRDRVWRSIVNAIACGARMFIITTDAELEAEDE